MIFTKNILKWKKFVSISIVCLYLPFLSYKKNIPCHPVKSRILISTEMVVDDIRISTSTRRNGNSHFD